MITKKQPIQTQILREYYKKYYIKELLMLFSLGLLICLSIVFIPKLVFTRDNYNYNYENFSINMMEEIIKAEFIKQLNIEKQNIDLTINIGDDKKTISLYGTIKNANNKELETKINESFKTKKKYYEKYVLKSFEDKNKNYVFTLIITMENNNWFM